MLRMLEVPPEDDGTYDLCDRYKGKWVDVVRHEGNGTWRGLYDLKEVVGPQSTRAEARSQLIDWLKQNT